MMTKYMQVVWLYVIGLSIIFIGIYSLMTSPGPASFVIMLVGLGIAAIGAAHGRRMRTMGGFDMQQMMRDKGFGPEKPKQAAQEPHEAEEAAPEEEKGNEAPKAGDFAPRPESALSKKISGITSIFSRGPQQEPLTQDDIMRMEMEDIKEGRIVPAEADVIMLVCPKCGAENESQNLFCYKCGTRLRRLTPGEKETGRISLKIDPGAITVVDDHRVAKVVICPKCNAANKVGDKFCWNCGKKLRSDSRESKEELMSVLEKTVAPKSRSTKKTKKTEPDFDNIFGTAEKKSKKIRKKKK